MTQILPESDHHVAARERLLDAAFGDDRFTRTCARLRDGRRPVDGLSLVVTDGDAVLGTLRFWHVRAGEAHRALMLGPVAVAASHRHRGIGAGLIRVGLERAYDLGHTAVILVGDAPYYGRFGFTREHMADLTLPGPYDPARFLGLELFHGGLTGAAGLVIPTGARLETPPGQRAAGNDWTRRSLRRRAA